MVASSPRRAHGGRRTAESLAAGLSVVDLEAGRAPIRLLSAADYQAAFGGTGGGRARDRYAEPLLAATGKQPPDPLNWALTILDDPVATSKDRITALWIVMGSIGRGWLR